MKYFKEAESEFFFDFVFYECENKKMYVYCPNCGCEHEIDLRHTTVAKAKQSYPCNCFSDRINLCSSSYYMHHYPHFYHASKRLADLNRSGFRAEFTKREDNSVGINVYHVVANFDAENHDYEGTCFKRRPVFDYELVSSFTFEKNGNVTIKTRIGKFMNYYSVQQEMRTTKNWAIAMADATIIRESANELVGTFLEDWIDKFDEINEAYSTRTNLSSWSDVWDAFFVGVLIDLHSNVAYCKMWKAGFTSLCINRTMRIRCISQNFGYMTQNLGHVDDRAIINYQAKTLDKIFKIEISKIDKILERNKAEVKDILAIKRMITLNIPLTPDNHYIYTQYRMPELEELCIKNSISLPRVIKYLRKNNVNSFDYHDYLHCTIELNTPLSKDVLFPSHFKAAHDRQTGLYAAQKSSITNRQFKAAVECYKDSNYIDDKYCIKLVDTVCKLKRWGARMHNCSGGYVDRVINGHSVIFVITEITQPKKAFAMLEYSPKSQDIVQLRGVHNSHCDVAVETWVRLWLSIVLLPSLLNHQNKETRNNEMCA